MADPKKLVRDRIDWHPWTNEEDKALLGWIDPASPEFRVLLMAKLREEVEELLEALDREDAADVLAEAADVYEVLLAVLHLHAPTVRPADALVAAATRKRAERGGFGGRIYTVPEGTDG